jgi:uncharacterized protein
MSMPTRPPSQPTPAEPAQIIRDRLKADLTRALKARQTPVAMTLRSLLGAIDNAEAVPLSAAPPSIDGRSRDVPRLALDRSDIQAILRREADECRRARADYEQVGQAEAAGAMHDALSLIEAYLDWTLLEEPQER